MEDRTLVILGKNEKPDRTLHWTDALDITFRPYFTLPQILAINGLRKELWQSDLYDCRFRGKAKQGNTRKGDSDEILEIKLDRDFVVWFFFYFYSQLQLLSKRERDIFLKELTDWEERETEIIREKEIKNISLRLHELLGAESPGLEKLIEEEKARFNTGKNGRVKK